VFHQPAFGQGLDDVHAVELEQRVDRLADPVSPLADGPGVCRVRHLAHIFVIGPSGLQEGAQKFVVVIVCQPANFEISFLPRGDQFT